MDSVSQIVLGASVAHITLGPKLGSRAILLGAALGTLPDLDVLIPYDGAIENFTYHRGFSHSLFVLSLLSVPIAWLCHKIFKVKDLNYKRWLLGCWLVLVTHPLLDGFTIYGTQLLWPLGVPPTALGSIFIIDPIYTLPLLFGVLAAYRLSWLQAKPYVIGGLLISSSYLIWTTVAQAKIKLKVENSLKTQGIVANDILVAPFPFSLLWRVVVLTDTEYREGFSSLLDDEKTVKLQQYSNGKSECAPLLELWPLQRLDWFTQGFFALSVQEDQLIATDLRMGIEDDYVFEFEIAEWESNRWQAIKTYQRPITIDGPRMMSLFHRIYNEDIDMSPLSYDLRAVPLNCQPSTSS